ncbi:hypothetical protein BH09BAC1_BH09BAC1_05560 [soil metagenome]
MPASKNILAGILFFRCLEQGLAVLKNETEKHP